MPENTLSKRELIAALALQGIAVNLGNNTPEQLAVWAIRYEDTLIKELSKNA
jgi:hypothetical protein